MPETATANIAVCPTETVWFAGCVVMAGATTTEFTVRSAPVDVALPALFVTVHRKRALLSEDAHAAVAKDAAVAPVAEAHVAPLSLLLCH